ncbi:MAG TPA: hypothetical protein IAB22_05675 [Candidatus Merdivicinus intestinavium]|nr:hypothetical protein [Candidatus Merdivicinus intestinavium]
MRCKYIPILLAMLAAAAFASCNSPAEENAESSAQESGSAPSEPEESPLAPLMAQLYAGMKEEDLPMRLETVLTEENSEYYTGVPFSSYREGLASDAAIGSIAHSVCLLRAEDEEAAKSLADEVEKSADPRKWVCVEAETKLVRQKGDLVVLIMTDASQAEQISANFDALED